ncbi:MAG: radical SAM protein [Anaerolineales bacterium]|jgi:radical SAM protein with 4Fe4S-binding SPASM domain|nr:radical SAM protein [Anaerolineales bacterium]
MEDHSYAVKRSLARQPLFQRGEPQLGHLDIELTERCNNACIHCYINLPAFDEQVAQRELSTEQWKAILQQAAELGALSVRFTGGEPLLRPDFAELYLFTRRLGIKVILFTNARLITPELADLFARVPPLKKIEVSVYGMTSESYAAVSCSPGAFSEFRRGVNLLLERRIPFMVKSTLLPPNRSEKEAFEAWAATIPGMDRRPAYSVFLDLRTRRDSPAKNQLISSLRFSPEEGVALLTGDEAAYRQSMAEFCAKFLRPHGAQLFTCGAGETGCVDAYGNYQMCMLMRHPDTVYDLSRGTMRQALAEFFPRLRELHAKNPDYLRRCARCFLKGLCEQCPAKSWSEHGTLDTPVEYLCQLAHAQARTLGLLAGEERGWEVVDWQARLAALEQKHISIHTEGEQ